MGQSASLTFVGKESGPLPGLISAQGAGGAGIAIGMSQPDGTPLPFNKATPAYALQEGTTTLVLEAYVQAEPQAITAQTLTPGDFTATATFELRVRQTVGQWTAAHQDLKADRLYDEKILQLQHSVSTLFVQPYRLQKAPSTPINERALNLLLTTFLGAGPGLIAGVAVLLCLSSCRKDAAGDKQEELT